MTANTKWHPHITLHADILSASLPWLCSFGEQKYHYGRRCRYDSPPLAIRNTSYSFSLALRARQPAHLHLLPIILWMPVLVTFSECVCLLYWAGCLHNHGACGTGWNGMIRRSLCPCLIDQRATCCCDAGHINEVTWHFHACFLFHKGPCLPRKLSYERSMTNNHSGRHWSPEYHRGRSDLIVFLVFAGAMYRAI